VSGKSSSKASASAAAGGDDENDSAGLTLDPTLLNVKSSVVSTLSEEQLCTLLQVKSVAALKYPVFLHFDHKRFKLTHLDFVANLGDVVKQ
jgi:hypothetical protein